MKKKHWTALLIAAVVSLSGCGQDAGAAPQTEDTGWETLADSERQEEKGTSAGGQEEETEPESVAEGTEDSGETQENGITITAQHFDGTSDPDDPTLNYTYSYDLPQVSIEGNEAAQEAIQADLQAYVERFLAGLKENDFGRIYEDENTDTGCYQDLTMTVLRADEKVISIQMGNEGYGGGAHGWWTTAYFNYFPQTGERITFDKLGVGFREKAEELVTEQARKKQQEENCFYEDFENSIPLVVLDGTENSADVYKRIYGDLMESEESTPMDATFYVSDTGFTFVSGQYVLQPYAGGVVEIEIPAADFGDACKADLWN